MDQIDELRKTRDEFAKYLGPNGIAILTFVANVLTHFPPSEHADVELWEEYAVEFLKEFDLSLVEVDDT